MRKIYAGPGLMSLPADKKYIGAGIQVQPALWEEFKRRTEAHGLKLKHAINRALELWIEECKRIDEKKE